MKTVIIDFILLCQLAIYGAAYAGPEEGAPEKGEIEKMKPALPADPFLQAEYLFHSGNFLGAKPLYHDYLSQSPSGKKSHHALFRLGSIDQSNQSYSTAVSFYQILLRNFSGSLLTNLARFNIAVCLYELSDYSRAKSMFKVVLRSSPDKKRKWEIMFYLALIDGRQMNYEKAFNKLKQIREQIEDKEIGKRALKIAENLINEKIEMAQVSVLIQKFGTGFPVDLLLLKSISSFRAVGDITNYMTSLEKFIKIFPTHRRKAEMENSLNQIKKDTGTKVKIGVVLPLTGKLALTGQKVLQGIQLAVNQLPLQARANFSLEVRDSGYQLPINEIVTDLSELPNVVGIIGPLLSDEVRIAGDSCQALSDPYIFTHSLNLWAGE